MTMIAYTIGTVTIRVVNITPTVLYSKLRRNLLRKTDMHLDIPAMWKKFSYGDVLTDDEVSYLYSKLNAVVEGMSGIPDYVAVFRTAVLDQDRLRQIAQARGLSK